MKRRDDILVGFTIIAALILVVGGAFFLSESQLGQDATFRTARFRTVGGLGVGNPVVLRGVRVGRIDEIRLGDGDWVETILQIYSNVQLPDDPAIIAASASLFGEWQADIISLAEATDDPNVRRDLDAAAAAGDDAWPGATLPDIGQLTAQAGRIASDIAAVSSRVQTAFDSEAVLNLQGSIRDFGEVTDRINQFATSQTEVLSEVGENVRDGAEVLRSAADALESTIARVDAATSAGELDTIVNNTMALSADLRAAAMALRELVAVVQANQASIENIIQGADTVVARLGSGQGTVGRLVGDSTLYIEAVQAIAELRSLVNDIKENPRKYFKFSVF
ncbi:MAG: MlaD family protein [Gemmatimonadetes bacterium]|nr:MlaD family protein [Gemmatimonadota bacterium]